ncbi:lactate utilization protein [Candidatus Azambacteria bacterium]|nr:lactate utilization protein [Candidatus Azambacteria bacterium]
MNYKTLADEKSIQKAIAALAERGVEGIAVVDGMEALAKIKEFIPQGASVMNGASRTLEQIGYVAYLKSGAHGWNNLHEKIFAEQDRTKQSALRKQATLSDYYLGSVHAIAETGEFVIASNTGSQLSHIVFNSPNLIFVAGTQKIVPTLADAMKRLKEYVVPLEDQNILKKYGMHTMLSKIVIFNRENSMMGRKVRLIFVKEKLGF